MTIKTVKKIDYEVEIPVPSFWKEPNSSCPYIIGLLDTDSVYIFYIGNSFSSMRVGTTVTESDTIEKAVTNYTEITEEEFFTEYNRVYASMRLQPEIKHAEFDREIHNNLKSQITW